MARGEHMGRGHQGSGLNQVGGEEGKRRRGRNLWASAFIEFQRGQRVKEDFTGRFECSLVTVRGGQKEEFVAGASLHTGAPGHSSGMFMLSL